MSQPATAAAKPANAAIHYQPEGYEANRPKVMGRHAAGAGFFEAMVWHSGTSDLYCLNRHEEGFKDFTDRVRRLGGKQRCHQVFLEDRERLAEIGNIFLPGPGLGEFAWRRRLDDERAYSLVGVTHTLSSDRVMDALGDLAVTPVHHWDAVICTSVSGRRAVERFMENRDSYLKDRFQAREIPRPHLPVIPLGVDPGRFKDGDLAARRRAALRQRLGLPENAVAGLFFGRLTFHAKAHPVPMLMAFAEAEKRLGDAVPLHLLLTGQFPNESIRGEFEEAIRRFWRADRVHILDGADAEISAESWHAADFFVSLSDNIQETFGLTPIEAMAAGLPALVSDWDGYRDTVVDGETGIRVPTLIPSEAAGPDLAVRYSYKTMNYDRYIGCVAMATAVDIRFCAGSIERLASDPALRARMGEAGRRRVAETYDWSVVIAAYQALWDELATVRRAQPPLAAVGGRLPFRPDPFHFFAEHATERLDLKATVRATGDLKQLARVCEGTLNTFAVEAMLAGPQMAKLMELVMAGPVTVTALLGRSEPSVRLRVLRSLVWLNKYDLVEFVS